MASKNHVALHMCVLIGTAVGCHPGGAVTITDSDPTQDTDTDTDTDTAADTAVDADTAVHATSGTTGDTAPYVTAHTSDTGPTPPSPPMLSGLNVSERPSDLDIAFELSDPDDDLVGGTLTVTIGSTPFSAPIPGGIDVWAPGGVSHVYAPFDDCGDRGDTWTIDLVATDAGGLDSAPASAMHTISGLGVQPVELGDDRASAEALGSVLSSVHICADIDNTFGSDQDIDWFRFMPSAGGTWTLRLAWPGQGDFDLYLTDSGGNDLVDADTRVGRDGFRAQWPRPGHEKSGPELAGPRGPLAYGVEAEDDGEENAFRTFAATSIAVSTTESPPGNSIIHAMERINGTLVARGSMMAAPAWTMPCSSTMCSSRVQAIWSSCAYASNTVSSERGRHSRAPSGADLSNAVANDRHTGQAAS